MENDLADSLDDLICTFDKAVSDGVSDVLAVLVGWLFFAGGIFLATNYILKTATSSTSALHELPTADNNTTRVEQIRESSNSPSVRDVVNLLGKKTLIPKSSEGVSAHTISTTLNTSVPNDNPKASGIGHTCV